MTTWQHGQVPRRVVEGQPVPLRALSPVPLSPAPAPGPQESAGQANSHKRMAVVSTRCPMGGWSKGTFWRRGPGRAGGQVGLCQTGGAGGLLDEEGTRATSLDAWKQNFRARRSLGAWGRPTPSLLDLPRPDCLGPVTLSPSRLGARPLSSTPLALFAQHVRSLQGTLRARLPLTPDP